MIEGEREKMIEARGRWRGTTDNRHQMEQKMEEMANVRCDGRTSRQMGRLRGAVRHKKTRRHTKTPNPPKTTHANPQQNAKTHQ